MVPIIRPPAGGRGAFARLFAVLLLLAVTGAGTASANTVTFDPPHPPGAWGAPFGDPPGSPMFVEDAISLRIHELSLGGLPFYNQCDISPPPAACFGSLRVLRYNNVNVEFDFSAVPTAPASVAFDYLDIGGTVNVRVNFAGPPIEAPDFLSLNGALVAPGVFLVATGAPCGGGTAGTVTLYGAVDDVWIGGQELFIDSVRIAQPGALPDGLVCDRLVDHETLPLGTCFGTCVGTPPGTAIFTEDAIQVGIDVLQTGGGPVYDLCRVEPSPGGGFGDFNVMRVSNVTQVYDFAALPFAVGKVTIEVLDQGGIENLQINGGTLYVGNLNVAVPPTPEPGIDFFLTETVTPVGVHGVITLLANPGVPIKRVRLGGQEFWIDNVCVESQCDRLVDVETQPIGTQYGAVVGQVPGDLWFVEDGIPVIGATFDPGFGPVFNSARVEPAFAGFGDSNVLHLNNVSALYDLSTLPLAVAEATFEFADLGGVENLQVNGAPLYIGDLALAPAAIAPGVTCTVLTTPIPGGVRGYVRLIGQLTTVVVGGQEFWIDNFCVNGEAPTTAPAIAQAPRLPQLDPARPNPFNPRTTLAFTLPARDQVRLDVYDLRGRHVRTLLDETRAAGRHQVTWDGRDDAGADVGSGAYVARLRASGSEQVQKLALIR